MPRRSRRRRGAAGCACTDRDLRPCLPPSEPNYATVLPLRSRDPQQDRRQRHHPQVLVGQLLIAGRHPPELFQPIDESLDAIALPVAFAVEGALGPLVAAAREHRAEAATGEVAAYP